MKAGEALAVSGYDLSAVVPTIRRDFDGRTQSAEIAVGASYQYAVPLGVSVGDEPTVLVLEPHHARAVGVLLQAAADAADQRKAVAG